jgi:hypothetical protein
MLIGVVAVVLLLLILQAATGWAWAFALSATSVGGLIFLLTLEDFLSHTGEPARFRCGESFDATPMPGWAFPGVRPRLRARAGLVPGVQIPIA